MNKWKKRGVLVLIICMLLTVSSPGWLSLGGIVHAAMDGDGSPEEPYRITTAGHLDKIRDMTVTEDTYFILMNDIDLSIYPTWEPIPDFLGHLNGYGNTISNLKIDKSSDDGVGLFANLLSGATIQNLNIDNANVRGNSKVGILVGHNVVDNVIHEVTVAGTVYGKNYVGGLMGLAQNIMISNSSAQVDVTGQGNYVGGLVGAQTGGKITESYAMGSVNASNQVGGLIGQSQQGEVSLSYATGEVNGSGNTGGLIGELSISSVTYSYATGEVTGTKNTGGLIGALLLDSNVTYSYATGHVIGNVDAGGLIGGIRTNGEVAFSFATGNVSGCDDIGGLVGDNDSSISNSYATGNVTGICGLGPSNSIGGLVGDNNSGGTIEYSFAIGLVTGDDNLGGLVGDNGSGSITNSYYDMDLTQQDDNNGIGLTSEQMKNLDNYKDWTDFSSIWSLNQHHDGYPHLIGTQGLRSFLTYLGNDSNDDSKLYSSKSYHTNSSVTIEDFNWTRTGYHFQGWNTEPDGNGRQYEVGETVQLNQSLLLYATWKRVGTGSGSGSSRSNNANLASLKIFSDGEELALSPEFATGKTTNYRAETTSSEVTIKATPSNTWATVTLEGDLLDEEKTVVVVKGENLFELVVKAENGAIKTYSLTIHRVVDDKLTPTIPRECTFYDVMGHWAERYICEAFELGIIDGHSISRFSPQSDITRVEFAAILLRIMDITSTTSLEGQSFIDQAQIPNWAQSTVSAAVEKGILNGYSDHSLRPLNSVSRAEMVTMMGRAMEWTTNQENTTFIDDADIPVWAKGHIQEAVQRGLVKGREDNRFSPSDSATRAEATVLLLRLWHVLDEVSKESKM